MLTDFLSAQRTWVMTKRGSDDLPIGALVDFVINPDSGIFEALWVQSREGLRLIALDDILQWNRNKITIADENDLSTPDDFPRVKAVIEREVPILRSKVFCGKKYIGRVKNFGFDTLSPRILTLRVHSGFLFWIQERIIPRSKILRIIPEGIFISENIIPRAEKILEENTVLPEVDS
ncbi:hypothetical protein K9L63_02150 [Candidatus Gracilibacteria bacterium]|nr:hypothetical protein [Candidatus Gracilibacteria bacterium]